VFPRPNRLIIPQYEPMPGLSLVAAAELLGESRRAIAAQVVDFAVRGIIRIARDGKRRFLLELADLGALESESTLAGMDERDILHVLFPGLQAGARRELSSGSNRGLGAQLKDPHRRVVARLLAAHLVRQSSLIERFLLFRQRQQTAPTANAHRHVDHLWGVRDYIELAEKDRLAMLQSPSGALSTPIDDLSVLRIHERLLPYAVLFGLEKEWMRELDLRYRNLPPEVLDGLSATLDVLEVTVHGAALVLDLADLAATVDAGSAFDGLGAFFGGLGDVLKDIDLPSIDF
jgi:hypothetical protein